MLQYKLNLKALLYYALFQLRFGFFSRFHSCFGYQHVGIKNVSENARKKQEKCKKMQENLSILHYEFGKNASLLRFSHVFDRVFAHKPYQNTTLTHSVIWA